MLFVAPTDSPAQLVDLHEILSKSMDAMFVAAQAKHIEMNLASSGHVRVNGDAVRLQQVFWYVKMSD